VSGVALFLKHNFDWGFLIMYKRYLIILIVGFLPLFTMLGCDEFDEDCGLGAVFCEEDE